MPSDGNGHLTEMRETTKQIKDQLSCSTAKQVRSAAIQNACRDFVTKYYGQARPVFSLQGLDDESLGGLDNWMQDLLVLTQKASLRTSYVNTIKATEREINGLEVALLTSSSVSQQPRSGVADGKERLIAQTLGGLVETAGCSYEQACIDLRDESRISYRGVAAELRESLREILDHLAPDKDVKSQTNFKLEKDRSRPTMQQKVRFILKSRGFNKSQSAAPEDAVSIVDERVGALARSVYTRSSLSTHVGTSKTEVQQIKAYVDVVLSELLEIG